MVAIVSLPFTSRSEIPPPKRNFPNTIGANDVVWTEDRQIYCIGKTDFREDNSQEYLWGMGLCLVWQQVWLQLCLENHDRTFSRNRMTGIQWIWRQVCLQPQNALSWCLWGCRCALLSGQMSDVTAFLAFL